MSTRCRVLAVRLLAAVTLGALPAVAVIAQRPAALDVRQLSPGVDTLRVIMNGQVVGLSVTDLSREGQHWRLRSTMIVAPIFSEAIDLTFDSTGAPLALTQHRKRDGGVIEAIANWRGTKVTGSHQTAGAPVAAPFEIEVPVGSLDESQVSLVLRSLPWAPGERWSLVTVSTSTRTIVRLDIEAIAPPSGSGSPRVPAPEVHAWRVSGGAWPTTYVIGARPPHPLLRLVVEDSPVEMVRP